MAAKLRRRWLGRPGGAVAAVPLSLAMAASLAGCGGGGTAAAGGAASATKSGEGEAPATIVIPTPATTAAVPVLTGTVRFHAFNVTVLSIVPDSGTPVYTPVNPPLNAFDGERVSFTFVPAQPLPGATAAGTPIALTSFQPIF